DDTAAAASNAAASMAPRARVFTLVVTQFMTVLPSGQRAIGLARILYYTPAQVRPSGRCRIAAMITRLAGMLTLVLMSCAAPARADWMQRTEAIMGTRCYVELWADDPDKGNDAIDAVMAELRRIDNLMSHYKPESELSQINQ